MSLLGSLVSAGTSLLGGYFSSQAQGNANDDNAALQREFAQNGIRWKVADAKAAGIHPLYALGAQTVAASPSAVGSTSLGDSISNAGQDISRSINATRTPQERRAAEINIAAAQADLDGKLIDNQIRASQLQKMRSVGPAMPSGGDDYTLEGQPSSGVKVVPLQRTASPRGRPETEAGSVSSMGYLETGSGQFPVRSSDAAQRMDDDTLGNLAWGFANRVLPTFGFNYKPPRPAPVGYDWLYNPSTQEYQLVPASSLKLTPRGLYKSFNRWLNR